MNYNWLYIQSQLENGAAYLLVSPLIIICYNISDTLAFVDHYDQLQVILLVIWFPIAVNWAAIDVN